jgi:exosortase/archaeosortase family protein
MLGVEEACSGIRSLQAVLMLALFFGELHRLTLIRRVTLLVSALATALLLNILRTAILVFMAARHGIEFSNRWHDTTGTAVLVFCFGAVWAIGRMLRLRGVQSETVKALEGRDPRASISSGKSHGEIGDSCHSSLQVDSGDRPSRRITPTPLPRKLLWSVIVCSAISVVGSELWFRMHERQHAGVEQWTINLPRERVAFREDTISPGVKAALQYDTGSSSVWQNNDGTQWQLFYFRWNPATTLNDRVRVHLAKSHRPEACLPKGGWQLEGEFLPTSVEIGGIPLLFRTYDFSSGGRSVFVFFCVREDGTAARNANMRESHASRWQAAWEGNRGLGQRSIEIAIFGARDLAHAETSLRQELPKLIQIQSNPL